MWIRHLFLGFIGLAAGGAVAAGTFAFIIVIGVVPRMIAKCNLAKYTVLFENMIVFGGIAGNLISVFTGAAASSRKRSSHAVRLKRRDFRRLYCRRAR